MPVAAVLCLHSVSADGVGASASATEWIPLSPPRCPFCYSLHTPTAFTNMLAQLYDNAGQGADLDETILTPGIVQYSQHSAG